MIAVLNFITLFLLPPGGNPSNLVDYCGYTGYTGYAEIKIPII